MSKQELLASIEQHRGNADGLQDLLQPDLVRLSSPYRVSLAE